METDEQMARRLAAEGDDVPDLVEDAQGSRLAAVVPDDASSVSTVEAGSNDAEGKGDNDAGSVACTIFSWLGRVRRGGQNSDVTHDTRVSLNRVCLQGLFCLSIPVSASRRRGVHPPSRPCCAGLCTSVRRR